MRRRWMPGLTVVMLVAVAGITGCVGNPLPMPVCVPRLAVAPVVAHPGETVTVTTRQACPVDGPADGWLVRLQPADAREPHAEERVVAASDGSFSVPLGVPDDMPTGLSTVWIVDWWEYAQCPDGASCASAEGSFQVDAP